MSGLAERRKDETVIYMETCYCGQLHTFNTDEFYPIEDSESCWSDCDCGRVVKIRFANPSPQSVVYSMEIKTW
jgi:hypothetical protein